MHCILPTMRSANIKILFFSILILSVYLFLFYLFLEVWFFKKDSPLVMTSVILPYVIVHIDLKGSPPKLEYLYSLLPLLKDHGANGLLVEYEDMFPYEGKLANLSAKNCYSRTELKNFLMTAVHSGFEIIPLVQTFGHLEYALKLEEFMHLREIPLHPDSLCPSKKESRAMVKYMLEQVVNFHNSISPLKYIHVGCDEVYHINKCAQCLNKGFSDKDIFLNYLRYLSNVITDMSPETTILIWDDMLRSIKHPDWLKIDCFNNIEPVYWDYSSILKVPHISLRNYHQKFKNIWAASAFKGADGKTATLPDLKERIWNHFSWMNLLLGFKLVGQDRPFNFMGIILTGWSRYSHMEPPCELLPASIPSLVLNLLIIRRFQSGVILDDDANGNIYEFWSKYIANEKHKGVECQKSLDIDKFDTLTCNFDSIELYNILMQYIRLADNIALAFNNEKIGLSSVEYYSKLKQINMNTLMEYRIRCNNTLNELRNVETKMVKAMQKYYNDDFIQEYVDYKTFNAKKQLTSVLKALYNYENNRVWARRPVAVTNISEVLFK